MNGHKLSEASLNGSFDRPRYVQGRAQLRIAGGCAIRVALQVVSIKAFDAIETAICRGSARYGREIDLGGFANLVDGSLVWIASLDTVHHAKSITVRARLARVHLTIAHWVHAIRYGARSADASRTARLIDEVVAGGALRANHIVCAVAPCLVVVVAIRDERTPFASVVVQAIGDLVISTTAFIATERANTIIA